MVVIVYKAQSPFILRGENYKILIQGRGILNRIDKDLWRLAKQDYRDYLEDLIRNGYLEASDSSDDKTLADQDVRSDTIKEAEQNQIASQNANNITANADENSKIIKALDTKREKLEKKAYSLGIKFDDNIDLETLKVLIKQEIKRQKGN